MYKYCGEYYTIKLCKNGEDASFLFEDHDDESLADAIFQVIYYILKNDERRVQNDKETLQ